ncbi:YjfI family protein [Pseudomonas huanghezhanensis]|uniref:YjfI family protein n=1 Tax=Pseudomonas huanghezhanensis TaxID=3002903 RepID=UPI00228684C3|nr:YjfI family protein [Pseudomonas sp. BSw22131]
MARKTSTDYMREMRARLTAAGYVKRELYVLPENADVLRNVEKVLRQPYLGNRIKLEEFMTENTNWTIDTLHWALIELDMVKSNEVELTLVQGAEPSLSLAMSSFGGLPIIIAIAGDQILVDSVLVYASQVKDIAAFNDTVLRSRDIFPLSSIGIETMPNGETVYNMFGALSAASSLTVIVHEVLTLADNVIRAADAYEDFLTVDSQ